MLEASRKGKKKGKRKQQDSIKRTQETIISNFWRVRFILFVVVSVWKVGSDCISLHKKNFVIDIVVMALCFYHFHVFCCTITEASI